MLGKTENNYCCVTIGAVSKVEIGCDWFNASLLFLFSSMTAGFNEQLFFEDAPHMS